MESVDYIDAVNAALDRLHNTGFYIGDSFANHGPMAAEALAKLGYCEEVDGWVDANIADRDHRPLPKASERIRDWRVALGDRNRGGDWVQLFQYELAEAPWRDVLRTWWPRLLPGCIGSLTHGLIRTAHAVRPLREADLPSELQIDELARALAFWATAFTSLTTDPGPGDDQEVAVVDRAVGDLTAEYAGHYAFTKPSFPIPLIHTITAPAAMRLLLPELPAELHAPSLRTMTQVNNEVFTRFGGQRASGSTEPIETGRTFAALAAEAVDIGDEHAIKICEAAMRENAIRPDARYLSAASTAVDLIRGR
jgi:hypothetical protein